MIRDDTTKERSVQSLVILVLVQGSIAGLTSLLCIYLLLHTGTPRPLA